RVSKKFPDAVLDAAGGRLVTAWLPAAAVGVGPASIPVVAAAIVVSRVAVLVPAVVTGFETSAIGLFVAVARANLVFDADASAVRAVVLDTIGIPAVGEAAVARIVAIHIGLPPVTRIATGVRHLMFR